MNDQKFPYSRHLGIVYFLLFLMYFPLNGQELQLKDSFRRAEKGDYMVISIRKTDTLLLVRSNDGKKLSLEEITIPESNVCPQMNWKEWFSKGAQGNTSWIVYDIDWEKLEVSQFFSVSKKCWFKWSESDHFLLKLLSLKLIKIPDGSRKKTGSSCDGHSYWQPPLIMAGRVVPDALFDGWKAKWPNDGSELSGKTIELYTPQEGRGYLSYFPYWLQISGSFARTKIRIIDSGRALEPSVYSDNVR